MAAVDEAAATKEGPGYADEKTDIILGERDGKEEAEVAEDDPDVAVAEEEAGKARGYTNMAAAAGLAACTSWKKKSCGCGSGVALCALKADATPTDEDEVEEAAADADAEPLPVLRRFLVFLSLAWL